MKFAKELEDALVPEWRVKYINYKQGKKKIKAISRALRTANRTPKTPGRPGLPSNPSYQGLPWTQYDFKRNEKQKESTDGHANDAADRSMHSARTQHEFPFASRRMSTTMFAMSPPIQPPSQPPDDSIPTSPDVEGERIPLKGKTTVGADQSKGRYGSFDNTTTDRGTMQPLVPMPSLELPDPALDPQIAQLQSFSFPAKEPAAPAAEPKIGQADGQSKQLGQSSKSKTAKPLMKMLFQKSKAKDDANKKKKGKRARMKHIFSPQQLDAASVSEVQLEAYKELDARQDDFFNFLDRELEKVEKFYRWKEEEAHDRLHALRAQLHEHRDQRARDMSVVDKPADGVNGENGILSGIPNGAPYPKTSNNTNGILSSLTSITGLKSKIGQTSKAMENLASPPGPNGRNEHKSDYTRRKKKDNQTVPHRFAKRRLKLALQEFYRGLELLKSYALLNRTGFRKINKKYDKAVNARPPLRYLNEKVNDAYFVKSTAIDEYLVAVEDLYARYFERGNRKIAVNKLRSKLREGDHSGSTFRNGVWVAAGAGLAITGLIQGVGFLNHDDPVMVLQTSYLLQLYAGYFLALLLFLLFVLDCRIWTKARVNYIFVFEYDTRHVLDWRQLAELPCFFLFLNGLFLWLNFQFEEAHPMYLYWPIVLIALTLIIMALPFKVLYYHARKWWGFSNFRLLFAGLYPVEFRDFFLGDMYCSQTYAMSQIEIFFCLYAGNWRNPPQCNSNHSMLLGFFTTLPAVWRFLQCLRRYYDSRNWFPHLANCAKYMGNILYYMSLSLYRLHVNADNELSYRIAFIVFATLNGIYCSFWDIAMDWSLGNFFSKNFLLRNRLAFRRRRYYYAAMILDATLRHQWIFFAIFTSDLQHSAAMSFFVSLAEVIRRGVWTIFRVENEHCNNVGQFRASRDIPLPYLLPESPEMSESPRLRKRKSPATPSEHASVKATGVDVDLERQNTRSSDGSSMRRRNSIVDPAPALKALQRVGTAIAAAHAQDFTKKRRTDVVGDSPLDEDMLQDHGEDSSDEDDDDVDWDDHEAEGNDNDNRSQSGSSGAGSRASGRLGYLGRKTSTVREEDED